MSSRPIEIHYEQAVYGSFPFWDKGYAVLAQSPGCRAEWLAELRAACQRFGERPGGVAKSEVRGLFAMRLVSGSRPWMIVGVGSPGSDDRGRPGALVFHALFLSGRDYRRAGCNPFALAGALQTDWTAATRRLPEGTRTIAPDDPPIAPDNPRAARVVTALERGRRVAIEAAAPIDALAHQVWPALPERVRRRASLATWAFGNGNRFDLVALPRLAGVALDPSYLDPAALDTVEEIPASSRFNARSLSRALMIVVGAVLLAGLINGMVGHRGDSVARARPDAPAVASSVADLPALDRSPPERSAYRDDPDDPDERRRVAEGLVALAERFGISEAGAVAREDDPTALMILIADRLRYHGPSLDAAELARLAAEPDRDRALALRWHAQVRRFADDRRLPDDFAAGPLRWQLDTLAWSFHLDPVDDDPTNGRRSAAEVPHALGEALAVDVPLPPRSSGLLLRHPALVAYRDFLSRLPRR